MKTIRTLLAVLAAVFVPQLLPAQVESLQSLVSQFNWSSVSATDSVVQVIAEEQGLQSVSPDQWPRSGTYWYVVAGANGGSAFPLPMPPSDPNTPVYLITGQTYLVDATAGQIITAQVGSKTPLSRSAAVAAQVNVVSNLINQVQEAEFNRQLAELFGEDEAQNPDSFILPTNDYTGLALQLTNVSNGYAYLNLLHATNWVYAIWSTTNLLSPWQLETELWPESTNSEPFTLATQGRQNLFLRAEDWTDVDSNGDGIPDWWVWFWYGDLGENATNVDANGNTLLSDYENGYDPNLITFTVQATNNYVNTMIAPLQLNLTSGKPYYVGVLVDDTNFNNASWDYYTGTNISVNLGLTQGWHDVWIGLAGFADDATEAVWQWRRLKLDFTAPLLVVTNPVAARVTQPMIEVQGYSSKALDGITYDLSNSACWLTNQDARVLDQFYDTNTFEFTTNTFQAFDLPLTNGLNVVTIHATDLAGNVTVTNFSFNLDYTTKTNPPLVQLIWPVNGMQICDSSVTLRGMVDDFNDTVTASITDTNGNTNTVTGQVERTGRFWLESLPLNSGTNMVSITVMDAAGNTTTTNLNLVQSTMKLALNPVADDLWNPTVNVSGTISDPTATIYVNGVQGTNNGDGTWNAGNVPVTAGGVASFYLKAIPANGDDPDEAVDTDKPDGVYLKKYHNELDNTDEEHYDGYDESGSRILSNTFQDQHKYTLDWESGAHGNSSDQDVWKEKDTFNGNVLLDDGGTCLNTITWPTSDLPLENGLASASGNCDDEEEQPTNQIVGAPQIEWEHCQVQDPKQIVYDPWEDGYGLYHPNDAVTTTFHRQADATIKLRTGGKQMPGKKSLWCLNASASKVVPPSQRAQPPYWAYSPMSTQPVSSQNITVAMKALGRDGNLWLALEDGQEVDATPQVKGMDFYTFGIQAQKYPVYITASGHNLDDETPEFCVGQQVNFVLNTLPAGVVNMAGQWTLPQKYVNESWQNVNYVADPDGFGETTAVPYGSVNYRINSSLLQDTNQTSCWFVNGSGGEVSVGLNLLMNNGQTVSVAANGSIKVYRPTVNLEPLPVNWQSHYYTINDDTGTTCKLKLGEDDESGDGTMRFSIDCWSKYSGQFGLTQLVTANYSNPIFIFSDERCDGQEYYSGPTGVRTANYTNSITGQPIPNALLDLDDGPNDIWISPNIVSLSARDFARFQPDGGIPVTLGIVTWETVGTAERSLLGDDWNITTDSITGPNGPDGSDEFPVWTQNQGGMR